MSPIPGTCSLECSVERARRVRAQQITVLLKQAHPSHRHTWPCSRASHPGSTPCVLSGICAKDTGVTRGREGGREHERMPSRERALRFTIKVILGQHCLRYALH